MKFDIEIPSIERTVTRYTVEAHNHEEAIQLALDGLADTSEIVEVELGEIDHAAITFNTGTLDLTGMYGWFKKQRVIRC